MDEYMENTSPSKPLPISQQNTQISVPKQNPLLIVIVIFLGIALVFIGAIASFLLHDNLSSIFGSRELATNNSALQTNPTGKTTIIEATPTIAYYEDKSPEQKIIESTNKLVEQEKKNIPKTKMTIDQITTEFNALLVEVDPQNRWQTSPFELQESLEKAIASNTKGKAIKEVAIYEDKSDTDVFFKLGSNLIKKGWESDIRLSGLATVMATDGYRKVTEDGTYFIKSKYSYNPNTGERTVWIILYFQPYL
jgi:hypothetical protein